jgi:hypothetical protein
MIPLPRFTADGLLDYAALAIGLVVGFSLFSPVADQVEKALAKN